MEITIHFARVRPDAKIPSKEQSNAGYDIYACFDEDYKIIPPHTTIMIPSGIASVCPDDYYFQLFERGSTGSKGLAQRCGVIDSSYRGEWFIPITNTTVRPIAIAKENHCLKDVIIYPYEKAISQVVLLPVPKVNVSEISYHELSSFQSGRGTGCLGSTNK